jgi:hypothetical protein
MSVSPVDVEKEISLLEDDYVDIEKRLCEVESLLKNRHILWNRFEKELENIQQSIQETDFMVELLTVHGNIDYDRLLKATERLEVILLNFSLYFKLKNIFRIFMMISEHVRMLLTILKFWHSLSLNSVKITWHRTLKQQCRRQPQS